MLCNTSANVIINAAMRNICFSFPSVLTKLKQVLCSKLTTLEYRMSIMTLFYHVQHFSPMVQQTYQEITISDSHKMNSLFILKY